MGIKSIFSKLKSFRFPYFKSKETFTEFHSRIFLECIESLTAETQSADTLFVLDPISNVPTLSAFGADTVEPYINSEYVSNLKAHYFVGYAGSRMPKTLFNSYRDKVQLKLESELQNLPTYKGDYVYDYDVVKSMLYLMIPMIPLMYYRSPDIEVPLTDYIGSLYKLIYDFHSGNVTSKSYIEDSMQDIYELATVLMYPLSVKGYTLLLKSMPAHLRVRMVSVKVKTRVTVKKQYVSPLVRRTEYVRENGIVE